MELLRANGTMWKNRKVTLIWKRLPIDLWERDGADEERRTFSSEPLKR